MLAHVGLSAWAFASHNAMQKPKILVGREREAQRRNKSFSEIAAVTWKALICTHLMSQC